jgi:hypothetical protein
METVEQALTATLIECCEDHLGLWRVVMTVEDDLRAGDVREAVLQILGELLEEGWIEAGDLGRAFVPWRLPPPAILVRIAREWDALGHDPGLGDIVWLRATAKGEREMASRLRRVKERIVEVCRPIPVEFHFVVAAAAQESFAPENVLGVLGELQEEGRLAVGDLVRSDFHPWKLSPDEVTERLEQEWEVEEEKGRRAPMAWFYSTEPGAGNRAAGLRR